MTDIGRLNRLKVDGFKSIKHLDFELGSLNVLIGPNGAGKSVFISLFKLVNRILDKDLQLYIRTQGGADKILHFGRQVTDAIDIYLKFSPNAYACRLVPTATGSLIFEREFCQFFGSDVGYLGGTKSYWLAKAGSEESGLPSQSGTASAPQHVVGYLRDWKVYHFHDTSETAKIKQPGNISDAARLRSDASNLAAFLHLIRRWKPAAYEKIVSTVQRVAPFFHDFVLEPEPDNAGSIRLRWKHRGTDAYFDASDLSDGTLRFICLATLLLQPELPTIILLDEPELGLHPYAVQLLASIMRSTSASTQIIASTQSVTLANQFDHQDLVVVDRVEESSRFRRLSEDEVKPWLDEYALGDLWEKNLIGGTP